MSGGMSGKCTRSCKEIMSLGWLWDCKLTGKMQALIIAKQYSMVGTSKQ